MQSSPKFYSFSYVCNVYLNVLLCILLHAVVKYFFASSACVTLRREFLSCQFQFSLRTSMKIELILAKSACFTTPVNIQEMTICPLHRERLGIGWRRSIIQRSVPEELSGHDDTAKQKAERGCTFRSLYYKP